MSSVAASSLLQIPVLSGYGVVSTTGNLLASQPVGEELTGKRVTLLHFTDTHAQLETHPEYVPGAETEVQMMGGYARLKTAIDQERANCAGACFLLDGGDEFQGAGPAAWSEGEVILEPLNAFGIDAFVPGNWEPAYGPERFKETMARLNCPVVCYNLHDEASGHRLFAPSVTIGRDDVRVACIGSPMSAPANANRRSNSAEWTRRESRAFVILSGNCVPVNGQIWSSGSVTLDYQFHDRWRVRFQNSM